MADSSSIPVVSVALGPDTRPAGIGVATGRVVHVALGAVVVPFEVYREHGGVLHLDRGLHVNSVAAPFASIPREDVPHDTSTATW